MGLKCHEKQKVIYNDPPRGCPSYSIELHKGNCVPVSACGGASEKGLLWDLLLLCTSCRDKSYVYQFIYLIGVYITPLRSVFSTKLLNQRQLEGSEWYICPRSQISPWSSLTNSLRPYVLSYYTASDNTSQNDSPCCSRKRLSGRFEHKTHRGMQHTQLNC
jgi:hypothetical protein